MIMNVSAFFQRFCQYQYEFSRIFLLILSISILPLLMKKKMREIQIPGISYHFLLFQSPIIHTSLNPLKGLLNCKNC